MFTKEQLIALGVPEEQVDAVLAEQTRIISEGTGEWVPQSRLAQAIRERDTARTQVTERDTQIANLSTFEGDNAALQARITELETLNQNQAATHDAEMLKFQQTQAVRNWLESSTDYKPHNADIVLGLINLEDVVFGKDADGKLTVIKGGLEEQVKPINEKEAYLFIPKEDPNPAGGNKTPLFSVTGKKPGESTPATPTTGEDYGKQMAANRLKQMGYAPQNPNGNQGGN